ncbi:DNA-binding domain-containing protein [Mesorhizobium sp. Z1-4]|uniref:HvfC/BufC N-terminal domain-containing protein n=1 Tax=Mesorhizobium sp. Z1-4 TaxID=2448478 RepID=UPI000FDA459D|nr:DNA-binding domain-containing protein [Mesorhizobium sp. Z1-4]
MPDAAAYERGFRGAILDPGTQTPAGLASAFGGIPTKRFDVYRNNVTVSLTKALADIFPAVCRIVGEERFADLARLFVRENPPKSPLLFRYGENFAAFIEAFAPAATMPYLADVARLEHAWLSAYHAADAAPLSPGALSAIAPDKLPQARFAKHPAAALVRSQYAAVTIFNANRDEQERRRINAGVPENGLITRPEFEVRLAPISGGDTAFLHALFAGKTLAEAAEAAVAADTGFDLSAAIGMMLSSGAFKAVDVKR